MGHMADTDLYKQQILNKRRVEADEKVADKKAAKFEQAHGEVKAEVAADKAVDPAIEQKAEKDARGDATQSTAAAQAEAEKAAGVKKIGGWKVSANEEIAHHEVSTAKEQMNVDKFKSAAAKALQKPAAQEIQMDLGEGLDLGTEIHNDLGEALGDDFDADLGESDEEEPRATKNASTTKKKATAKAKTKKASTATKAAAQTTNVKKP